MVTCLWYDGTAEEAADFYAATFPNSSVDTVTRAPGDFPTGEQGQVLTVDFTLLGQKFFGLNGGPGYPLTQAISLQVLTEDQAETDRYWDALLTNGGQASACGWCRDRWGLHWQITPRAMVAMLQSPDRAAAARAFAAMQTMVKLDIAVLDRAFKDETA
nr:VOC family protein [Sphingomonas vulcanisoli]